MAKGRKINAFKKLDSDKKITQQTSISSLPKIGSVTGRELSV